MLRALVRFFSSGSAYSSGISFFLILHCAAPCNELLPFKQQAGEGMRVARGRGGLIGPQVVSFQGTFHRRWSTSPFWGCQQDKISQQRGLHLP